MGQKVNVFHQWGLFRETGAHPQNAQQTTPQIMLSSLGLGFADALGTDHRHNVTTATTCDEISRRRLHIESPYFLYFLYFPVFCLLFACFLLAFSLSFFSHIIIFF